LKRIDDEVDGARDLFASPRTIPATVCIFGIHEIHDFRLEATSIRWCADCAARSAWGR